MKCGSVPTPSPASATSGIGIVADEVRFMSQIARILDRAEEIITGSPSDERGALNNALQALRVLEQVAAKEKPAA